MDWFKYITGQTQNSFFQTPTMGQVVTSVLKDYASNDDLLPLGFVEGYGDVEITQGERDGGTIVLGSSREGKSKFLEYICRKDVDRLIADQHKPEEQRRSCGFLFIDPSDNGDTAYKILKYCASKGFRKVFLVDPDTLQYGKIASLNPLRCATSNIPMSVASMRDSFEVLFGVTDSARTSNITTYLSAILHVLHHTGGTLHDAKYFAVPPNKFKNTFDLTRDVILAEARRPGCEQYVELLRHAYQNFPVFNQTAASTFRRLFQVFEDDRLDLIFGHREGVNFNRLIKEGWVILVNVSGLGTLPTRLLAATVINQVIFSMKRLTKHGFKKPFNIFVDEVSEFATRSLAQVLNLHGKLGLRLVLAHQYMGQIEEKYIADAVHVNTKIKVSFYISGTEERRKVMEMMGYDRDSEIWEALSRQEKQSMVIRVNKNEPVIARVYDTPDIEYDTDEFIRSLLDSPNNVACYHTPEEIHKDYETRFGVSPQNLKPPKNSQKTDSRSNRKNPKRKISDNRKKTGKDGEGEPLSF